MVNEVPNIIAQDSNYKNGQLIKMLKPESTLNVFVGSTFIQSLNRNGGLDRKESLVFLAWLPEPCSDLTFLCISGDL